MRRCDLDLLPKSLSLGTCQVGTTSNGIAMTEPSKIVSIAKAAHSRWMIASLYLALRRRARTQPATIVHRAQLAAKDGLLAIWGGTVGLHRKLTPFGAWQPDVHRVAAAFILSDQVAA
jgi:hypothetical protein